MEIWHLPRVCFKKSAQHMLRIRLGKHETISDGGCTHLFHLQCTEFECNMSYLQILLPGAGNKALFWGPGRRKMCKVNLLCKRGCDYDFGRCYLVIESFAEKITIVSLQNMCGMLEEENKTCGEDCWELQYCLKYGTGKRQGRIKWALVLRCRVMRKGWQVLGPVLNHLRNRCSPDLDP